MRLPGSWVRMEPIFAYTSDCNPGFHSDPGSHFDDRMDTIAFEIEVESLDEYFNNQRTNYDELSPETVESVRKFNINKVGGSRQIWEVVL